MVIGPVFENYQVEANENKDQQNKPRYEESSQRGSHLIVLEFQLLIVPNLGLLEFIWLEVSVVLGVQGVSCLANLLLH